MAMAVLPASYQVDLDRLKKVAGVKKAELASEKEFSEFFPESEVGAMPPFGNLYDLEVYVASALTEDEEIAFNAGSHTELIRLPYSDFESAVEPTVGEFAAKE
jgi:Ala-tRNA(Pro) deacylase